MTHHPVGHPLGQPAEASGAARFVGAAPRRTAGPASAPRTVERGRH
ncbi:hypothetical protein [Streptomyces sp. NPDC057702]